LVLTTIYTFWLKNIVILDVFTIGILFVIRGMIGSQVVWVDLSQWLIIMLFFGALFLWFFKRYQEVSMWGEHTRKVIKEYNKEFLQQIVSIITAVLIVSYALYTFQSSQPSAMIVTLPFVIFVIVRYYYNILVQQKYKESIEDIIMQDKQILLAWILYIVLTIIILLYTRV
jgi:4-hydroxybenzoate polyprenyltransferase